MSETKWTPGPWRRDEYGHVVAGGRNVLFTGCTLTSGNHPEESEAEANTDLATAAPDLYGALAALVDADEDEDDVAFAAARLDARDALKKARGE